MKSFPPGPACSPGTASGAAGRGLYRVRDLGLWEQEIGKQTSSEASEATGSRDNLSEMYG